MAKTICEISAEHVARIEQAITPEWEKAPTILKRANVGRAYVTSMEHLAREKGWESQWRRTKGTQTSLFYRLPPAT